MLAQTLYHGFFLIFLLLSFLSIKNSENKYRLNGMNVFLRSVNIQCVKYLQILWRQIISVTTQQTFSANTTAILEFLVGEKFRFFIIDIMIDVTKIL